MLTQPGVLKSDFTAAFLFLPRVMEWMEESSAAEGEIMNRAHNFLHLHPDEILALNMISTQPTSFLKHVKQYILFLDRFPFDRGP